MPNTKEKIKALICQNNINKTNIKAEKEICSQCMSLEGSYPK